MKNKRELMDKMLSIQKEYLATIEKLANIIVESNVIIKDMETLEVNPAQESTKADIKEVNKIKFAMLEPTEIVYQHLLETYE